LLGRHLTESGDQLATRILVELGTEFLVAIILVVPIWRIFSRAGFSGFWALLVFISFAGYLRALHHRGHGDEKILGATERVLSSLHDLLHELLRA